MFNLQVRRFFISILVIFISASFLTTLSCSKNAYASIKVVDEDFSESEYKDFFVLSVNPEDSLPSSVKYPSIQVLFSQPVIPLAKLSEESATSEFFSIEPPLEGTFRWLGTSLLSFETSQEIPSQAEYTIKINPQLESLSGVKLSGQTTFKFHSEELEALFIRPAYESVKEKNYVDRNCVPPELADSIALFFNYPVDCNYVSKFISVGTKKQKYNFTAKQLYDYAIEITLDKSSQIPFDEEIFVTLEKGAASKEKSLATSKEKSLSFKTGSALKFKNISGSKYDFPNSIVLEYSRALKEGQEDVILSSLTIQPSSDFLLTKENISVKGAYVVISGIEFENGKEYTVSLDTDLYDNFGKISESRALNQKVKVSKANNSYVYFDYSDFSILEGQFEPNIAFSYKNPVDGYYGVKPVVEGQDEDSTNYTYFQSFDPYEYVKNEDKVVVVPLRDAIKKTKDGYSGAAFFYSAFQIPEYYSWYDSEKIVSRTKSQTIQVTDLGITVRYDTNRALVLVTKLSSGQPLPGATVNFYDAGENSYQPSLIKKGDIILSAITDQNGFAELKFDKRLERNNGYYIEAIYEDDSVYCAPNNVNLWSTAAYSDQLIKPLIPEYKTFMFTDRKLYKPGEKVTFRGIDRALLDGKYSPVNETYSLKLTDGDWWNPKTIMEISTGTTSQNGTFWGTVTLPEDLKPGDYCIYYQTGTHKKSCNITVQFFEKLRFQATTSFPSITFYSGDEISASISASYLGGGTMNGSHYETSWERYPGYFSPQGTEFESYAFGPNSDYDGGHYISTSEGTLSDDGSANVSVKSGNEKLKGTPYYYRVGSSISDVGNQMIYTSSSILVHPARYYIGLSSYKDVSGFPKAGSALKFDYILLSPEKKIASSDVLGKQMKIELIHDKWIKVQQASVTGKLYTRWEKQTETEVETNVTLKSSASPSTITVTPKEGGSYKLRLSSTDVNGNEVITERNFYVTSSDMNWFYNADETEIKMTADKSLYNVGDTAQIFMESPLPAGTYMITTERENIISHELRTLDKSTDVLNIEIDSSYVPVVYVTVSSYSTRTAPPKESYADVDLGKPKGYFGLARLNVSTDAVSFNVEITPSKTTYRPGDDASISLLAKDSKGNPVPNAEITLMAVDRGVIDLVNYHVPNPIEFFWSAYNFPDCVKGGDSRYYLLDPVTFENKNLIGGDEGSDDKFDERKNFDPTALFLPSLKTDENGRASCNFTLPDSLTAYRITAVGVKENNFSINEDEISVANPVSVRQVLPRMLRVNDKGELGIVLSNLDNISHTLDVEMNIYSGIEKSGTKQNAGQIQKLPGKASVIGERKKQISVGADKSDSLMFQISAEEEGWITVEFITKSDVLNEKLLLPLQIEKPYIWESVTTVGQIYGNNTTESQTEELILPSNIEDGKGQLKIVLDPTRLGTLTDAISYVFHYPYGCLEQRSSAILPLAIFGDYIDVFGMENEVLDPDSVIEEEIASWKPYQLSDGGFPYWKNGKTSNAYVSARIAEICAICQDKGIDISQLINIDSLSAYLYKNAVELLSQESSSHGMNEFNAAYDFYILSRLNYAFNTSYLADIMENKMTDVDTAAYVALTYLNLDQEIVAKTISKSLRKYVSYTTRGCSISSMIDSNSIYIDPFMRGSSTALALLLKLNSLLDANDEINQHLLFELSMIQKEENGYWHSTSETARVLDSIAAYIWANDFDSLDFTASALLGQAKNPEEPIPSSAKNILATGSFKGASAKSIAVISDFQKGPLSKIKRDEPLELTFSRTGKGTLFYTASMKYAVKAEEQFAKDHGISISVIYYDAKTGKSVPGDKLVQGNTYKAKVCLSTVKDRSHVAVRVPVPAGCEILNAAFDTTGTLPKESTSVTDTDSETLSSADSFPWRYYDDCDDEELYYAFTKKDNSYFYQYYGPLSSQAIYDCEVQYFFDELYQGYQEMNFYFRATRKGTYNLPSASAECMYQEEIFGRTNGKIWTVE